MVAEQERVESRDVPMLLAKALELELGWKPSVNVLRSWLAVGICLSSGERVLLHAWRNDTAAGRGRWWSTRSHVAEFARRISGADRE